MSEAKDDIARLRQAFEACFDRVHALEAENASLTEQVEGLTRERDDALATISLRQSQYRKQQEHDTATIERLREDCETYKASMKSYFAQTINLGLAKDKAQAGEKRLTYLVQMLIDNSPNELIADSGETVIDLWRHHARASLSNTSEGGERNGD